MDIDHILLKLLAEAEEGRTISLDELTRRFEEYIKDHNPFLAVSPEITIQMTNVVVQLQPLIHTYRFVDETTEGYQITVLGTTMAGGPLPRLVVS